MKDILWAEILKIRRSKVFWIILIAFSVMPVMMGFIMFVMKDPELAKSAGLMGKKASLQGNADWQTYLGMLAQLISIGGVVGFGFITSWVFGREYAERTMKDLLALPISRISIVWAKFIAICMWCLFLTCMIFALGMTIGALIQLDGFTNEILQDSMVTFFVSALLVILLCPPVAFFASFGGGYLSPIGFVILAVIVAQVAGAVGFGDYFPWAIPALYSGAAGAENAKLEMISFVILFMTSVIGVINTLIWWRYADHH